MTALRVGVAGATGALGKEIIAVLERSPWRPDVLVPLARSSTSVPFVQYGDHQVAVDDIQYQVLEELDVLFLALPRSAVAELADRIVQASIPVVDCSGYFASQSLGPTLCPWINPEQGALFESHDVACLPSPSGLLLASVMGPLHRAGLSGHLQATVMLSASTAGRAGVEELSKQVVALFNSSTPPRGVFGHGLAFDVLPEASESTDDGWCQGELQVAADLNAMMEHGFEVEPTLVLVPLFSGMAAQITLRFGKQVPLELIKRILGDGGCRLTEEGGQLRPRSVEGKPFVHLGRLRLSADGQSFHCWAVMDNLRTSAMCAVSSCALLLRSRGLLSGDRDD